MLRESESEKVERPRCRVVGRSSNNANANGGLVYSNANNVSTNSNTNNGSRLTFSRKIFAPLDNIIGSSAQPRVGDSIFRRT